MKYERIAIGFDDMLARIERDTDEPWRDVIGWNHKELDELEAEMAHGNQDQATLDTHANLQRELILSLKSTWWQVSWPEHVINPRYNSDANYGRCRTREEALDGAVEYGS